MTQATARAWEQKPVVMMTLLLLSIALLDSLSMLPLAIGPLSLSQQHALRLAAALVTGIASAYFLVGLAILIGMDALLDAVQPSLERWWRDPNAAELVAQLLIGLLLLAMALLGAVFVADAVSWFVGHPITPFD